MKDVSLEAAPTTKPGADAELIGRARAVLEANWLGHGTSPSLQLYPHQWSWDAACIAMGYASWNQSRAEQELRSLFAGQWRNGLLPHIVFTEGASYFPGPTSGRPSARRTLPSGLGPPESSSLRSTRRPRGRCTVRASRPAAGDGISRRALPAAPIVARVPLSRALPERGRSRRDLAPVGVGDGQLPALGRGARADVARTRRASRSTSASTCEVADAAERPSDAEYDRYVYLVGLFRELAYEPSRIREAVPFALQPVLFNSLLVRSNQDLAEIARVLGSDADPFEAWAESTGAGLESLWDDEQAVYVDYDVIAGKRVGVATAAGLAPLYAGVPDRQAARSAWSSGSRTRASPVGDSGWAVTSLSPGRSGLPADALLARAGVADPELGAPARSRALRVPGARRAGPAGGRRPRPERGVLGALRPAHRQGARRRAVRLDGGARPRPPPGRRSTTREVGERGH